MARLHPVKRLHRYLRKRRRKVNPTSPLVKRLALARRERLKPQDSPLERKNLLRRCRRKRKAKPLKSSPPLPVSRRNISASKRSFLLAEKEDLIEAVQRRAAEREAQAAGKPRGTKKSPTVPGREQKEKGETNEVLGQMANVSEATMRRARIVAQEGTEEQKEAVRKSGRRP